MAGGSEGLELDPASEKPSRHLTDDHCSGFARAQHGTQHGLFLPPERLVQGEGMIRLSHRGFAGVDGESDEAARGAPSTLRSQGERDSGSRGSIDRILARIDAEGRHQDAVLDAFDTTAQVLHFAHDGAENFLTFKGSVAPLGYAGAQEGNQSAWSVPGWIRGRGLLE